MEVDPLFWPVVALLCSKLRQGRIKATAFGNEDVCPVLFCDPENPPKAFLFYLVFFGVSSFSVPPFSLSSFRRPWFWRFLRLWRGRVFLEFDRRSTSRRHPPFLSEDTVLDCSVEI